MIAAARFRDRGGGAAAGRARSAAPAALAALALVALAAQRGGLHPESFGLPTAACGAAVVLIPLLARRQGLRLAEWLQVAALLLLALLACCSARWAPGGLDSVLPETQLLALATAWLAALLLAFRRATALVVALAAALVAIVLWALEQHLLSSGPVADAYGGVRLADPIGYWNALGLWAAMGLALCAALAARAQALWLRMAAAAACVPLATALYLTFSRGAWIAFAAGVVAALALDPRRVGLVASLLATAPLPALAILVASRSHGLTHTDAPLAQTRADGRSLALALLVLAGLAALAALGSDRLRLRIALRPSLRRAFAVALIALCALAAVGAVARFGAPWTVASSTADRFEAPNGQPGRNLNSRLFDLSSDGRSQLWRAAWKDAREHPAIGSGAGSFAGYWYRHRSVILDVDNAHSLYLETLAELGVAGLALLATALGLPLLAAWRARRHPLAAGALAAYVAFLIHMAGDWDWQFAAVALAGIGCGAALVVMARRMAPRQGELRSGRGASGALALGGAAAVAFALWSLSWSLPLGQARDAVADGRWRAAEGHARTAVARAGAFSAVSWRLLGEAQTGLGERTAARASLRVAVRRDPSAWRGWYDLALVARGAERRAAAHRALALDPVSDETQRLVRATG